MLSLAYVSTASFPYSDGDLATLLMNCRVNNAQLDLTGILLYRDGQFMQVLEGPDDVVRARYAVIAADPRHKEVRTLIEDRITARQFPAWTMGYRALTDTLVRVIPGYDDFFEVRLRRAGAPETVTRARRLIEWFRNVSLTPVPVP